MIALDGGGRDGVGEDDAGEDATGLAETCRGNLRLGYTI